MFLKIWKKSLLSGVLERVGRVTVNITDFFFFHLRDVEFTKFSHIMEQHKQRLYAMKMNRLTIYNALKQERNTVTYTSYQIHMPIMFLLFLEN